jgi:hypothetical protein
MLQRLEVRCDHLSSLALGVGEEQVFKHEVRLAVEYMKSGVDRCHADRLRLALTNPGVAEQQNVFVVSDEPPACQVEDERSSEDIEPRIGGIERPYAAKSLWPSRVSQCAGRVVAATRHERAG